MARDRALRVLVLMAAVWSLIIALIGFCTAPSFGHGRSGALDRPAPVPSGWKPLFVDGDGYPVRWDPCFPIRVAIDSKNVPYPGFASDVNAAVVEMAGITGLDLQFVGTVPAKTEMHVVTLHDPTAIQIEILWVPSAGEPFSGYAGWTSVMPSSYDGRQFDENEVRLAGWLPNPASWTPHVLRHELGHALGLDHVDDAKSIMSTTYYGTSWSAGDLAGLKAVGAEAGCFD